MRSSSGERARFVTTQWSLVVAAANRESPGAEEALEQLCARYWYPVFAFVRRRGHDPEEAKDLTQGFFARLIEKNDIRAADRDRGRFRTFLLTSCRNYLANQWDYDRRQKRSGGQIALSIDALLAEGRHQESMTSAETPESEFDRQWCLTLLDTVLDTLRSDYGGSGREAVFERLRGFLTFDQDAGSYEEAASDLDMSPAAVKVAVYRLRKRYREALRNAIAETVASEEEIDDELRYLLNSLT